MRKKTFLAIPSQCCHQMKTTKPPDSWKSWIFELSFALYIKLLEPHRSLPFNKIHKNLIFEFLHSELMQESFKVRIFGPLVSSWLVYVFGLICGPLYNTYSHVFMIMHCQNEKFIRKNKYWFLVCFTWRLLSSNGIELMLS